MSNSMVFEIFGWIHEISNQAPLLPFLTHTGLKEGGGEEPGNKARNRQQMVMSVHIIYCIVGNFHRSVPERYNPEILIF